MATGKSYGLSRVAPLTWGVLSSYGGDDPCELLLIQ